MSNICSKPIVKRFNQYMLPGTLSKAFAVGKALRENASSANNIESVLSDLIGAKKLFEGVISAYNGGDEKGYYVGSIFINGENNCEGSNFKIWFKNENHIAWKDDKVYLTSPDLISIVDQESHCPKYYGFDFDAKFIK